VNVLVERLICGPTVADELSARAQIIARLFNTVIDVERSGLRVLQCRGYYRDENPSSFGLVYEILGPKTIPITLRQLIKDTSRERSSRPDLGDLFELATKVVRCILEVHRIGWVHRSISSYNILFPPDSTSQIVPLRSPYLIGFNHCREDAWLAFTQALNADLHINQLRYQHPEYVRMAHGYRPEYDFYSVGVVMLEIGRWRTLSQLTSFKKGERRTINKPNEIREILVNECEQNLGSSMGAQYRNAVRACLTSDFITNRGGDELRNDFERKVLNQLTKCRA